MINYTAPSSATPPRVGVIDIGSNSVRLVVYDALKRVPIPIFNEKTLCGLARGLEETGHMNRTGVALAHQALSRFTYIAKFLNVSELFVLATAAVRDASDGPAFVDSLKEKYDLNVQIISGQEEAKYAALGVASSIYHVDGMIADLGGGSLEIADVKGRNINDCASFQIGLLRLMAQTNGDVKKLRTVVDQHLKDHPIIKQLEGRTFYTVGGGFRSLARMHIAKTRYPLNILHHYIVPATNLQKMTHEISRMNLDQLEKYPGVTLKRMDMIATTAMVAERIIALGKPKNITFSAHGIREGFLFGQLIKKGQQKDPLIAACEYIMKGQPDTAPYSKELMDWLKPLFEDGKHLAHPNTSEQTSESAVRPLWSIKGNALTAETPGMKRLRHAACILSEIARYEHTEYRSEIAFRRVMDSYLIGINHPSRIYLALALFHRYEFNPEANLITAVKKLLKKEIAHHARVLGYAMRLARNIAAGAPNILPHTRLEVSNVTLILHFDEVTHGLMGEAVNKRLGQLAAAIDLTPIISVPNDRRTDWRDEAKTEN